MSTAQNGRAVAYTVSVRGATCLVTFMAGHHPSTSRETVMRDSAKPMEPCLGGDGWETASGTVVPPASRLGEKITAAKMSFGREACIQRIYINEVHRMGTVANGGFCPFLGI